MVLGLEVGPGLDEPLRHLPMALFSRNVEGRHASGRINPVEAAGSGALAATEKEAEEILRALRLCV